MRERHIVITGGTGALGAAVTRHLLEEGARITVSFVSPDEARALEDSLDAAARERLTLQEADLTQEDAVRDLLATPPRLDALIHLVGGFMMGPLPEVDLQAYRRHLDLNLTTTFLTCKHAVTRMREHGHGRIVTVSSDATRKPAANLAVYAASKAAVLTLTRALAEETRDEDITANAIVPTIIDTPQNRASMGAENADQWLDPADLARVIAFLASPEAGDLRGSAITF